MALTPKKNETEEAYLFWNLRTSSKRATSARGFAITVRAVGRGAQGSTPCKGAAGQDALRAKPCEGPVVAGRGLRLRAGRDPQGTSCESPAGSVNNIDVGGHKMSLCRLSREGS